MPKLSDHFKVSELACPHTGVIKTATNYDANGSVKDNFIFDLEALRVAYDTPMAVHSCCRSVDHNKAVGGHFRSLHMFDNQHHECDTCAIDIARPNGFTLAKLIRCALKLGWSIGVAPDFIHLDMRTKYTKNALEQRVYTY